MHPVVPPEWPPRMDRAAIRLVEGSVVLTPLREADAPALLDLARESREDIYPWMRWTDGFHSLDGAIAKIAEWLGEWNRQQGYAFAAWDAGSGAMIGGGSLGQFNAKNRFCNLAYWVRTSARGRGIGPTITRGLSRFGFEQLGLLRIEILMEPENTASRRVAEKSGAQREGILRNRILNLTGPKTALLYSLIPSDLSPTTSQPSELAPGSESPSREP